MPIFHFDIGEGIKDLIRQLTLNFQTAFIEASFTNVEVPVTQQDMYMLKSYFFSLQFHPHVGLCISRIPDVGNLLTASYVSGQQQS